MITELVLGAEAVSYILKELSISGIYAKMLLSQFLGAGKITTYYPSSLDPAFSVNFTKSVYLSYGEKMNSEVLPKIVSRITSYLSSRDNRYAIFSTYAKVGDPFLGTLKSVPHYVSYRKNVFYLIPSWDHSEESILNTLVHSTNYPTICGLASLPPHQDRLQPRQVLSKDLLTQLAENTEYIIVGAYDEEGYLIWERA